MNKLDKANQRIAALEASHKEWLDKTEWVQSTSTARELGWHRADILKSRIDALVAELAAMRAGGKPVAWLDPWTGNKVTTDYDVYGRQGILLYTQQPAAQDAARLDWLERAGPTSICVVMDRLHDGEYEVAPDDSPGGYGKTLRVAIDASTASQQGEKHE